MAKGYDAAKASAIKRLNERQAEIGRKFGYNSPIYQDYHNALVLAVGPENINASGNIKRGPITYELLDEDTLSALLRHQTAGQIKKAAEKEAREQSEATGETVTWQDVVEARESVDTIIADSPDDFYEAVKFYWNSVGGKGHPRPTYTQLDDICEMQRHGVDYNPFTGEELNTSTVEDKLRKRLVAQTEARESQMLTSYFG